jgi:hypothetical protein
MIYVIRGFKAIALGMGTTLLLWMAYYLCVGVMPSSGVAGIINSISTIVALGYGLTPLEK